MKKILINTTLLFCFSILLFACKKKTIEEKTNDITTNVFTDFANKVAIANYKSISEKADLLNASILALNLNTTDFNLTTCKNDWYALRSEWEKSESFLFGPVATEQLDPQVDDWPVNKKDLDSLLTSSNLFTDSYIQNLQTSLKGFHSLEYILFGENGNKAANQLTTREKEYMLALSKELKRVCNLMHTSWDLNSGNYASNFVNAGTNSSVYKTKREALLEIVNAMAGICDEVANGKIEEPFIAQNPKLEESQFSKNSFTDFKNNMIGVQNVYLCAYGTSGTSVSEWLKQYNSSLDNKIKTQITASINTFTLYTVPFGEAIINNQSQILNSQKTLNELSSTLENELIPLINLKIKN